LPDAISAGRPRIPGAVPRTGELGHPDTPTELSGCPTAADALGDLPDLDCYSELWTSDFVAMTEADREAMQGHASAYARRLRGETDDPTDLSWPRRRSPSRLSASMRTSHGVDVIKRFASTPPGQRESVSRFIRLHPGGVSPTLRAGTAPDRDSYSAPRPIHYEHDRLSSPMPHETSLCQPPAVCTGRKRRPISPGSCRSARPRSARGARRRTRSPRSAWVELGGEKG
jgi:hypothetical protein